MPYDYCFVENLLRIIVGVCPGRIYEFYSIVG